MKPRLGLTVLYHLAATDAEAINRRRKDARDQLDWHREHKTGAQIHVGNDVHEGDEFPMVITRLWGADAMSAVNGQVLLDGNDLFWATSTCFGVGPRHFHYLED